jgi:hypothetical protein
VGEGEIKVYLDGDSAHATLCGTGTEDYIGTGWGQGLYANAFQGCHHADNEALRYGFYRLHLPDPIYFHEDVRVTIQQLGCWDPESLKAMVEAGQELWHGDARIDMAAALADTENRYGIFERRDDWSSCAYFYLAAPENGLPALAPASERMADLET